MTSESPGHSLDYPASRCANKAVLFLPSVLLFLFHSPAAGRCHLSVCVLLPSTILSGSSVVDFDFDFHFHTLFPILAAKWSIQLRPPRSPDPTGVSPTLSDSLACSGHYIPGLRSLWTDGFPPLRLVSSRPDSSPGRSILIRYGV